MSRILIDVERMKYPDSGLGEFCRNLSGTLLKEVNANDKITFLRPPGLVLPFAASSTLEVAFWHRALSIPSGAFDLWHSTHQDSPYLPRYSKTRLLLTIHDLNFLQENRPSKTKARLKRLQKKIDRADAVSTISQFTLDQVQQHLRLGQKPTKVIHNGILSLEGAQMKAPMGDFSRPFFLFLGMVRPKKNIHSLIALMPKFPDYDLIIAGNTEHSYAQYLRDLCLQSKVEKQVRLTGTVSAEEKAWLFNHCRAFLFPSLAEGFGMPILEAMSLGKLVVAQKSTSLPEVGGPDIFYFENSAPSSMESNLREALHTFAKNPGLAELWKKRAQQFNWQNSAREYLAFYRALL